MDRFGRGARQLTGDEQKNKQSLDSPKKSKQTKTFCLNNWVKSALKYFKSVLNEYQVCLNKLIELYNQSSWFTNLFLGLTILIVEWSNITAFSKDSFVLKVRHYSYNLFSFFCIVSFLAILSFQPSFSFGYKSIILHL